MLGTMKFCVAIFLILIEVLVDETTAFNFEVINPLVRRGEPGTYFGYSVAQHRTKVEGSSISDNW